MVPNRSNDGRIEKMNSVLAFYRFNIEELEVIVMQDGAIGFPPPFLALNAPEEDVRPLGV